MKNILKQTAIGVMSLALTASILPAQDFHRDYREGDRVQTVSRQEGRRFDRDDRGVTIRRDNYQGYRDHRDGRDERGRAGRWGDRR